MKLVHTCGNTVHSLYNTMFRVQRNGPCYNLIVLYVTVSSEIIAMVFFSRNFAHGKKLA